MGGTDVVPTGYWLMPFGPICICRLSRRKMLGFLDLISDDRLYRARLRALRTWQRYAAPH